ncbi:MAG: 3'-5' exonuclease, partial [Acidobacteriota bacterium]
LELGQTRQRVDHPVVAAREPRAQRLGQKARYKIALIDEFQDTDLVQYDIFRRLFGDGPLILVGDPKQAIYRFRGADVYAYLRAKRDADRVFTLNRNWRSSEKLIDAVNGLFGGAPRPFIERDIPYPVATSAPAAAGRRLAGDGDSAAFTFLWIGREPQAARAEQRIARAVAAKIARLLEAAPTLEEGERSARPLRPADLAVLVRTNQQARLMQDRLREAGVPAVLSRTGDIFRSGELEELLRLLAAVLEPSAGGRLRAACATVLWGEDALDLRRLSEDDSLFQERVDQFRAYRQAWERHGFVSMMEQLLLGRGVRLRLAALERGERRLTNLQHAIEIAHQATHDHHLSPAGLVSWLRAERDLGLRDRHAAELRLESDDAAVQIVTVHKSKGLEYEVVFCPFLWQARPIRETPVLVHESPEKVLFDCGSERQAVHLQMAEAERIAEDLRLLYVALTRARRRTYAAWGPIGRGPRSARSALAYLLHRRQRQLEPGAETALETARRVAAGLEEAQDRHESWLEDLRPPPAPA